MTSRLARSPWLWASALLVACSQGPSPGRASGSGTTPPPSPEPGAAAVAGLIPSREAEQAAALSRVERELERTLGTIDGVRTARVHLAVPRRDPFDERATPPATAAVLLRTTPDCRLADDPVRALVAAAVEGLHAPAVSVIRVPVEPAEAPPELVRVGPFTVTAASSRGLRAMLAALAVLNIAWVTLVLRAWLRHRRPGPTRPVAREAR